MLSIVNTFKVILTFVFFRNKMCKLISIFHALLNFDMYQCEKPCFMNQTMPQKYTVKNKYGGLWFFSHICVHKLRQLFKWVKNSNILYWLLYTYFPFMVSQSMSEYLTSPLILYSSMDDFFFFLVSLVSVEAFVLLAVLCLYIRVDVYFIIDEFSYLSVLFTCTMLVACSPWQGYLPLLSVSQFIMFSGSRLSVLCSYSLWDASGFTF